MSKRQFWLTRVIVEVLSEEEPVQYQDLSDLHYAITDGECSGKIKTDNVVMLEGEAAAKALQEQGSDSEFFQLDAEGNDIEI